MHKDEMRNNEQGRPHIAPPKGPIQRGKQKPGGPGGPPPAGPRGPGGPPGAGLIEKPKDFSASLKKLSAFSKEYIPVLFFAVILSAISSVLTLIGPSQLQEITDIMVLGINTQNDVDAVFEICIILLGIYVFSLLFGFLQGSLMATTSQKIGKNLRTALVLKINKLPLSYFDKRAYGDILSHVTNDTVTITQSLNQSMSTIISGVITFVGALILMFYTNWIMATAGLLSTLLGFGLMKLIISNSQKFFKAQQRELGMLNGNIEEIYTGHTIVKAYNGEKMAKEEFSGLNFALFNSAWKAQYISGLMMPVMQFSGNFSYAVVCIVGALLAMNGTISFGVIVAFMVYIKLFTKPLSELAQSINVLQSAAAAAERVFELLEEAELSKENDKIERKENVKGYIKFENVKFGYSEDKMIIDGFSSEVKAGQKVAIVGPTGAGKTTMVNLLMRFYEINSGDIYIDGTTIKNITRENIHEMFAMVLQDAWMFEGTISENIAYGMPDVSQQEIEDACKAVGIHHTIKTMAKGYKTIMSSATLSEGEKQLITIARAMVKKSDLLILDEATSSVDTRTELLIGKAMDKLAKGKTSFIIAHRLSTIKNADLILVMKDGNIIESGNHEELLVKKGFYAELYNSQFEEVA